MIPMVCDAAARAVRVLDEELREDANDVGT